MLCGAITAGLTLIGTTTYFVATRLIRKKRTRNQKSDQNDHEGLMGGDGEYDDFGYMSDEDDLDYRVRKDRKRRSAAGMRGGSDTASQRPTIITFVELFEQAFFLHQQRLAQRNVKIYFDSNDEFVR